MLCNSVILCSDSSHGFAMNQPFCNGVDYSVWIRFAILKKITEKNCFAILKKNYANASKHISFFPGLYSKESQIRGMHNTT